MLEIWGRKNSSNVMPVMWTVGELGLEHQRHNLGGSFGGDNTEEYQKLNPNQLIPTINDNGFVLWESMAITRYLSRKYGMGTLCPDDPQQTALADQWMEWHKANIMPNFMNVFRNMVRTPKPEQDPVVIERCTAATINHLRILEQHLQERSYILGDKFSMGDIPLGATMYKFFNLDIKRPELPNIEAWYARLCERPAFQTHAMIPSGTNPEEWLELEQAGA